MIGGRATSVDPARRRIGRPHSERGSARLPQLRHREPALDPEEPIDVVVPVERARRFPPDPASFRVLDQRPDVFRRHFLEPDPDRAVPPLLLSAGPLVSESRLEKVAAQREQHRVRVRTFHRTFAIRTDHLDLDRSIRVSKHVGHAP